MAVKKENKRRVRDSLIPVMLFLRLTSGRLLNPALFPVYLPKFFPTPKRAVYKKSLAEYFFSN